MRSTNHPEHRWSLPEVLANRPAVRVNQLGYLPGGPSRATWVTDRREPAAFAVHRPDGSVALRGTSRPWPVRPEPTSGLAVHVLDLSGLTHPGGYEVAAAGERSHAFRVAADLYDRLADDALAVLHLLRSGWEVDGSALSRLRAPRRPSGSPAEPRGHRGPGVVRSRRGAPVPRVAAHGLVRRLGRLVRRGRLRQVRRQRGRRGVAASRRRGAAAHRSRRDRGRAGGGGPRRVPLAARLAAADAGAARAAARRHGLPPGARHRVVTAAGVGTRGPDRPRPAPPVHRGDPAPRRRRGQGRPAVPAGRSSLRRAAARRGAHRPRGGSVAPGPAGSGRRGCARRRPVRGSRRGRRPVLGGRGALAHHGRGRVPRRGPRLGRARPGCLRPRRLRLRPGRRAGPPRPRDRRSRAPRTTTASSPTSSQRLVACRTWPASSRGGSPTRRRTAGRGARTVASSTTSSSWRPRTS